MWEKNDPLLQLPYFTEEEIKKYRRNLKQHQIPNATIETFCRLKPEQRAQLELFGGDKAKLAELEKVVINGCEESNYPGILNLSFAAVEGESLLMRLPGIALSSGSACTSASLEPSYVLRSMGSDVDLAHSSIRFVSICKTVVLKVLDLVLDDLQQRKKLTIQPTN